jgi:hypothetical protein
MRKFEAWIARCFSPDGFPESNVRGQKRISEPVRGGTSFAIARAGQSTKGRPARWSGPIRLEVAQCMAQLM